MVFQDRNWTARPWVITHEQVDAGPDSFAINLTARGTFDAEPFTWRGHLTGALDGTVTFAFDGETSAPFLRNRLGLCVLHPIRETVGKPAVLERVDGTIASLQFPDDISPDAPFTFMRALSHEVTPGLRATIRMTGETFESEDHRNWSDASFKHYCTPISLPFPVTVNPDEHIEQSVTLTLQGQVEASPKLRPLTIEIRDEWHDLPGIGIQLDHDAHRLTSVEIDRLRALQLDHVRINLTPAHTSRDLEQLLREVDAIGTRALVVLDGADPGEYMSFHADPRIREWLIFDPTTKTTDPRRVATAERILDATVGGGTNLYFTELNRARPSAAEVMAFSINPQVHASDDQSVMQNAMTQGVIARNARELYPQARLLGSPITLRPRFNPNATAPELDLSNTPLPSRVDARQCLPFTAAWTALSIKAIAESGCLDATTYFEATGWEGIMERDGGTTQPRDFSSTPGQTYPVYSLLAALAGGRRVHVCTSSHPDVVDALIVDTTAFVINATDEPQAVALAGHTVALGPYAIVELDLGGTT